MDRTVRALERRAVWHPRKATDFMATRLGAEQVQAILMIVGQHASGATLGEIARALSPTPEQRTLQRWLNLMAEGGCLVATGNGAVTRYLVATPATEPTQAALPSVDHGRVTGRVPDADGSDNPGVAASVASGSANVPRPAPSFADLFSQSVYQIVAGVLPRTSVIALLQAQASSSLMTDEDRRAYVAYGRDETDRLTLDDAVRHGLEPGQYALWRTHYDRGGAAPVGLGDSGHSADPLPQPEPARMHSEDDGSPSAQPRYRGNASPSCAMSHRAETHLGAGGRTADIPRSATVRMPEQKCEIRTAESDRNTNSENRKMGMDDGGTRAAPASGVPPTQQALSAASALNALKPLTAAEAERIWERLRLADLRRRGLAVITETVNRTRMVIALLWGTVAVVLVRWLVTAIMTHLATGSSAGTLASIAQLLGYLGIPLAGLPWLYFRWSDRKRAATKLDGLDFLATLVAGGLVDLYAGDVVAGVLALLGL